MNSEHTKRERVLHTALTIVGTQGIHSLTHGRVDAAAGLPRGSTSNHFRTRAALVTGTVEYLTALETGMFAGGVRPRSVDELVDALAAFVRDAAGPNRVVASARLAFFAEAAHDPQVRAILAEPAARIRTVAAEYLEDLGVARPFEAARRVLAQLDGAILRRLALGDEAGAEADFAAVLRSSLS